MSWRAEKESEKRVTEQGVSECGGKLEALSDGKEFCHQNGGRDRQPPGNGSGTYWDIHCSPNTGRCWEAGAVRVYVEGVVVLSVQEVVENYPALHQTVCL